MPPLRQSEAQRVRRRIIWLRKYGQVRGASHERARWHQMARATNSPPNISNGFNWLRCRVVRIVATCPDRGEQTTKMLTETGWGGNVTLYAILGLWLALVQERKQRRLGRGQLRSVGERNQRRVQSDAVTPQGECG